MFITSKHYSVLIKNYRTILSYTSIRITYYSIHYKYVGLIITTALLNESCFGVSHLSADCQSQIHNNVLSSCKHKGQEAEESGNLSILQSIIHYQSESVRSLVLFSFRRAQPTPKFQQVIKMSRNDRNTIISIVLPPEERLKKQVLEFAVVEIDANVPPKR